MSRFTSLLIAILLWPCFGAAQVPAAYHATLLGRGVAMAMNNLGQVAGLDDANRPTVWSRNGAATLLPGQVYTESIAGINDDGTVVGYGELALPGTGYVQPLIWRNGGSAARLDLPGLGAVPQGINQRGDVVGAINPPPEWPGNIGGFLKRESGTVYFDGYYPAAINDLGDVAGLGEHGVAIWRNGELSDVPAGCCGFVTAMNNHDWIIGAINDGFDAGIWKDGQLSRLWYGTANDINDAGMVIGDRGYDRPALWFEGQAYLLDHLWHEAQWSEWTLIHAIAINERGEIAAQALNIVSNESRIVLLSPVPEPAMAIMLLLGLPLLSLARRSA